EAGKGVGGGVGVCEMDVVEWELGRAALDLGEVQPDQSEDAVTETKAAPPLPGVAGSCSAVNHLPKSVVREIRTLRYVGTGGGRPPPVTRWMGNGALPNGPSHRTYPRLYPRRRPAMSNMGSALEALGDVPPMSGDFAC